MSNNIELQLNVGQHPLQVPIYVARLLRLNATELTQELIVAAEQNPMLELRKPASMVLTQATGPSLRDHLFTQLRRLPLTDSARKDALAVAGEVDSDGRLPSPELLRSQLRMSMARLKKSSTTVQGLDPIGVGACNLRECLLLQLGAKPPSGPVQAAITIIRDHFDSLARRRIDLLPKIERQASLKLISTLNPRVGNKFAKVSTSLLPELRVFKRTGNWLVELIDSDSPIILTPNADTATGQLARLRTDAKSIIDALTFRRKALLTIANAAVARQRRYFEYGRAYLVPLPLRQLASDTGFALSTISTVVAGKALQSPHGVIALKSLLQRRTKGRLNFSAAALQESIKQLIATENPTKPLSDAQIVRHLAAAGGAPARRTVTKHRIVAGILPASLRKRS